jgi:hypothetical protein
MPLTASDVVALVRLLDDDQLSALRYRAFELQDDVATTEEERNAAYRETLELELLSAIGAL